VLSIRLAVNYWATDVLVFPGYFFFFSFLAGSKNSVLYTAISALHSSLQDSHCTKQSF
jgi:hypothetical protein